MSRSAEGMYPVETTDGEMDLYVSTWTSGASSILHDDPRVCHSQRRALEFRLSSSFSRTTFFLFALKGVSNEDNCDFIDEMDQRSVMVPEHHDLTVFSIDWSTALFPIVS